jgi:L-threonylcarbamoyladenylate synthase
MQIKKVNQENCQELVELAGEILRKNGLVIFPSDTVYGLAVNAESATAVSKLFQFKERPHNQSVSIAVKTLEEAKKYVSINPSQKPLLQTLLPGPYTIVLPSTHKAVRQLEAEDGSLGIRIPAYWFTKKLSNYLPFPYTATSANLHGRGPHHSIKALLNTLSTKKQGGIDLILDFGVLPANLPSTVINLTEQTPQILRQGNYHFKLTKKTLSLNPQQTRELAFELAMKYVKTLRTKPVLFLLQGEMGTGKTVFSQGLGEALGISRVVSPTYVIYYEYRSKKLPALKFHHFDLYRLENDTELSVFNIPTLLKPNNFLVFEWGTRLGSLGTLLKSSNYQTVLVKLTDLGPEKRQFEVFEL